MTEPALNYALRNLRHLYEQMLSGHVRATPEDVARAATGLLGPAIEQIEREVITGGTGRPRFSSGCLAVIHERGMSADPMVHTTHDADGRVIRVGWRSLQMTPDVAYWLACRLLAELNYPGSPSDNSPQPAPPRNR